MRDEHVTDLPTVLRRRLAVVLVGLLAGAALGVAVAAALEPADPAARVEVEILPTGIDLSQASSRMDGALEIDRAIARLTSEPVLTAATAGTDVPLGVAELEDALSVRRLGAAPVVSVLVTHPDPSVAVAASTAVARAYLEQEEAAAVGAQQARLDQLQARLDDTLAELGAYGVQLGSTEDPARIAALEGQQDLALRRATELEREIVDVEDENTDPGRIARDAVVVEPGRLLGEAVAVPAAAALGLLVGIAAAVVVDRRDRRVWDPWDVAAATGSAEVVHLDRDDLTGDGLRTGGGHRRLRTLVAPAQSSAASVLVTGSSAEHGAGVATGLAVAVAAAGRTTILLDASGADAFGLPPSDLTGWLAGRVGLDRAARTPDGAPTLRVLSGTADVELAGSATLRELLASPQSVLVVHAPGGADSGDALALAGVVDRVVVVAAARRDTADTVARTHRWLARDARRDPVVVLAG